MQQPTEDSVEWARRQLVARPTKLIRVTVTVRWADGNEYTTYGLVSA